VSTNEPPGERHLFFDNMSIEMVQDVTRVMHTPVKTGPALIHKDKPWEHIPYFGNGIWSILYSPAERTFRCWYEDWVLDLDGLINSNVDITDPSISSSRVMYAESRDGVNWEKTSLGIVHEGGHDTNIVLGDSVADQNVTLGRFLAPVCRPDLQPRDTGAEPGAVRQHDVEPVDLAIWRAGPVVGYGRSGRPTRPTCALRPRTPARGACQSGLP